MSHKTTAPLNEYRKAAKRLKKAYANGEADAVVRVSAHIDAKKPLKHADFLHVIAREAGHLSWPQLKFALEAADMSFEQRARRLKVALYHGQHWITDRLLRDDPALAAADFGLQVALYDRPAVERTLRNDPQAAIRKVGVRSPILHLAFSKEIHRSPSKRGGMLEIAKHLVALGADVNDGYPATPGDEHQLSALYGALCHADNFDLGVWLLENGADPNDNESLYHSTELDGTRSLVCLLEHGAKPDGTNALPRALDFHDLEKVRLLLEAGTDPNATVPDHPSGQPVDSLPALHHAARRGCPAEIISLLLDHGADPHRLWHGHTAYATARIFGNGDAADLLANRRAASSLTASESNLASCAGGKIPKHPFAADLLHLEDQLLINRVVLLPGRLDHIKALVAGGLNPDLPDEMGLTPLHSAGWAGAPEVFDYLLTLEPDLDRKNAFGGDALETVIHGSEHGTGQNSDGYLRCAQLLLEAGSRISARTVENCGNEAMTAFLEDWIGDHPARL